jgi:hypothetical protein
MILVPRGRRHGGAGVTSCRRVQKRDKILSILTSFVRETSRQHDRPIWKVDMSNFDPRPAARSLIESGDVSVDGLWLEYWARGGNADVLELDAFIHEILLLQGIEVEVLQVTLNELPAG